MPTKEQMKEHEAYLREFGHEPEPNVMRKLFGDAPVRNAPVQCIKQTAKGTGDAS